MVRLWPGLGAEPEMAREQSGVVGWSDFSSRLALFPNMSYRDQMCICLQQRGVPSSQVRVVSELSHAPSTKEKCSRGCSSPPASPVPSFQASLCLMKAQPPLQPWPIAKRDSGCHPHAASTAARPAAPSGFFSSFLGSDKLGLFGYLHSFFTFSSPS